MDRGNLEFTVEDFAGCCGIKLVIDFYIDFDYKDEGNKYETIPDLKRIFKYHLTNEKVGMLVATTALRNLQNGKYGDEEERMIENKLKACGWKRKSSAINPNTDNKITLWTFT